MSYNKNRYSKLQAGSIMKIMGHRGARNEKPENTLAGFKHIISLGLKCVELDIHLSRDGEIVVIHDATLERTTNGTGPINAQDLSSLQSLDAGEGEKIPTLNEVLSLLLPEGFEIQIEIKDPNSVIPLIKFLKDLDAKQRKNLIIISFDHRTIFEVKKAIPSIRTTGIVYAYPLGPCSLIKAANADGLSINIEFADADLVKKIHAQNFFVTVWNANTKEQYEKMKNIGIDYMATDTPTEILKWAK